MQIHSSSEVEHYWRKYLDTLNPKDPVPKSHEVWYFGDTEKLAKELAELVKTGQKTATNALLWEEEAKGERTARVGDVVVVTD
mgnify:FL=1